MQNKVKGGTDHRTQITVAMIGLAGVLGTAAIANLPRLLEVLGLSAPQRHEAGGHRQPSPGAGPEDSERDSPAADRGSPGSTGRPLVGPAADPPSPSEPRNPFQLRAIIDDPDGYTNVRGRSSVSGAIIDRMVTGETFYTYIQEGDWWRIKTPRGKIGYMHMSRIKLLPPGSGPPDS